MNKAQETIDFAVTDAAAAQICKIMAEKNGKGFFRVAVNAGGCSGFQYEFIIDDSPKAIDRIIEKNGAKVLIDDVSIGFLDNAALDWVDELIGSAFKIVNPNARSSCGCGMSFAV